MQESGGVIQLLAQEGDTVEVGSVVAKIDTSAAPVKKEATPAKEQVKEATEKQTATPVSKDSPAKGHPSVSANKMMKEKGIDPASVQGSGRGGRITKTDVVTHKTAPPPPPKEEAPKPPSPAHP